jgi:hypothetical protein
VFGQEKSDGEPALLTHCGVYDDWPRHSNVRHQYRAERLLSRHGDNERLAANGDTPILSLSVAVTQCVPVRDAVGETAHSSMILPPLIFFVHFPKCAQSTRQKEAGALMGYLPNDYGS